MWPAIQKCQHKRNAENDRLSQLPDDVLLLIMSFLTMKEAAKTSVLSHRWEFLWRCFPVLIFEDYPAMKRMFDDDKTVPHERLSFLRWVNRVLEVHLGLLIDDFRVTFDLDSSCQSEVDKWVNFALAKRVKSLELDFRALTAFNRWNSLPPKWRTCLDKSCLRSLCLKYVNVTTKDVDSILLSCLALDNLCIAFSRSLRYVRAVGSPVQLKHCEVSYCPRLRTIDILAPKLLSFRHHGDPIQLHIRNASSLLKVSVGDNQYGGDVLAYAFDSLSNYFLQLEYLSWHMQLSNMCYVYNAEFNVGLNDPPAMMNLKHLELNVYTMCHQTLLGWADLIEASPLLERLTVKITLYHGVPNRRIVKRNGRPLKSLKTLELYGDLGLPIDLEFTTYVIENSIMLKNVIVGLRPLGGLLSEYVNTQDQVAKIKRIVPRGVKLTINWVSIHVTY